MSSAQEVYAAFKSHKQRQEEILATVKLELEQVRSDFEAVSDGLSDTVARVFPTLESLPLDMMTVASRVRHIGVERDFSHLVKTLQLAARANRKEMEQLVRTHGSPEDIDAQLLNLDKVLDEKRRELVTLSDGIITDSGVLGRYTESFRPIADYESKYGQTLTDDTAPDYRDFSALKFLTDGHWRDAHAAVRDFDKRKVGSIDAYRAQIDGVKSGLDAKKLAESTVIRGVTEALTQKEGLEDIKGRMATKEEAYMSEAKIHAAVCSNFAGLLEHDDVASFIGKNLSPEQAEPLMIETLKLHNLRAVHDNLEALRHQAETVLGKVSEPISKLEKFSRRKPNGTVDVDLDALEEKLNKFNTAAQAHVDRSQNVRGALTSFAPSRYASDGASATHADGSFGLLNYLFLYHMMAQSSAGAPMDSGSVHVDAFNSSSTKDYIPMFDGGIPALAGDIPSIPDMGDFNISATGGESINLGSFDAGGGYSGGYDGGGGYSGGFDGGGGGCDGGGACVTASITDDPIFRRHLRFECT